MISSYFGPKCVMVAFAKSAHQAGQPDKRQIEPTKKLAVSCMPKLMHTDLVAKDISLPFAKHPRTGPKVDESAERYAHAVIAARLYRKGDATQGIDTVDLTSQSPSYRIEPSHKGRGQFPSEPGKDLPHAAPWRTFGISQEKSSCELGDEAQPMIKGSSHNKKVAQRYATFLSNHHIKIQSYVQKGMPGLCSSASSPSSQVCNNRFCIPTTNLEFILKQINRGPFFHCLSSIFLELCFLTIQDTYNIDIPKFYSIC